nr:unnamed protein product [Callosobruchus analis]
MRRSCWLWSPGSVGSTPA